MAGLINTQRAGAAPDAGQSDAQAMPAQPAGDGDITADMVRSKMAIPPQLRNAYDRVVAAGKKVLYSEQMAPEIQQMLQGPGNMGEKLGRGIAALMALLVSQANSTMPPQVIIPAAIELVADAGDMLKQAGAKVTPQDTAEGMAVLVQTILEHAGVDPSQLPQLLAQQSQGAAGGGQAEEAAESPQEQAAEGPQGEADEEVAPEEEDDSAAPQVAADGRPSFGKKGA